jgi:hypothetical protein
MSRVRRVRPIGDHEVVPLVRWRRGWVVGLERRAGAGRPSSSSIPREVEADVQRNSNPSLPGRHARRSDRRPPAAHRRDAVARQGAGHRPVAGRAAGDNPGAHPLLDDRLRLAHVRGEAERAAAVHDRDRRGGRPLHPREVGSRGRVAADHHARLARVGHRTARGRRPARGPDRAWRLRRGRVRVVLPSVPGYGFSPTRWAARRPRGWPVST